MFIERYIDGIYYDISEVGLFKDIEIIYNQDIIVEEELRLYHTLSNKLSYVKIWFFYPQQISDGKLNGYEFITKLNSIGNQYGLFISFDYKTNFEDTTYQRIGYGYGVDETSGIYIPTISDTKELMQKDGVVEAGSICKFKLKLVFPYDIIEHVSTYQLSLYISYLENE